MAKKYYNKEYLPILPEINSAMYPYLFLMKGTNGDYILYAISTDSLVLYPTTQQAIVVDEDCVAIEYTLSDSSSEWVSDLKQATYAAGTAIPTASYEIAWANFDIIDSDNFTLYNFSSMIPVDFYCDLSDTEGKIKIDVGEEYSIYKASDDVFTIEQLSTMTGYESIEMTAPYLDMNITFLEAYPISELNIESAPFIMIGSYSIMVPYDGCEFDGIVFPEKGIYCASLVGLKSTDYTCTGQQIGFNLPTVEPVVIYEGEVTTVESNGLATANIQLNELVNDRELVLTTVNETEYFDTGFVNNGNLLFGEIDENSNPDFTNKPYLVTVSGVTSQNAVITTETAGTYSVKMVRYMSGKLNKIAREVELNVDDTLFVESGQSYRIQVLSDNASAENPKYTFTTSSNFKNIGTITADGLITITSAPKDGYTYYISISSDETENYHDFYRTIYIDDSNRVITANVDGSFVNIGVPKKITIDDNASSESPTYSYTCSNTSVATIDSDGYITATAPGFFVITVSSPATKNYSSGSDATSSIYAEVFVEPEEKMTYDYLFNFSDENWETRFPDNYSTTWNYAWRTDATFTYNNRRTLRSYPISSSKTSQHVINFTLVQAGSIEFNYTVSSEATHDVMTISLDGVEIVKKSGTVDWTVYSQELDAGDHVLELKYTKDGSVNTGSDACAIGYLRIKGMAADYERKYLINANNEFYTVTNGALSKLQVTELTSQVFSLYGFDEKPTFEQLSGLVNPTVLLWNNSTEDAPSLTVKQTATPPSQTVVISKPVDLSDETIAGVEKVNTTCTGNPLYACSFNGGTTWKMFNGTNWVDADNKSGMTANVLTSITTEQWAEILNGLESFMFRFILNTLRDSVTNIVVDFLNPTDIIEQ